MDTGGSHKAPTSSSPGIQYRVVGEDEGESVFDSGVSLSDRY